MNLLGFGNAITAALAVCGVLSVLESVPHDAARQRDAMLLAMLDRALHTLEQGSAGIETTLASQVGDEQPIVQRPAVARS